MGADRMPITQLLVEAGRDPSEHEIPDSHLEDVTDMPGKKVSGFNPIDIRICFMPKVVHMTNRGDCMTSRDGVLDYPRVLSSDHLRNSDQSKGVRSEPLNVRFALVSVCAGQS